jgi:DNA-binding NtrC family response regulator
MFYIFEGMMAEKLEFPLLKVLHLDDDPFEWERVRDALEKNVLDCHFQVRSVGNEKDYKTTLNSFKPDVCILDIHMADGSDAGISIAGFTRSETPNSVIIMCSSSDDVKTIGTSLNSGADDFISKKTDKGELSLRVYNAYRLSRIKIGGGVSKKSSKKSKSSSVGQTMDRLGQRAPNILESAITAVFIRGESGTGKEVVSEVFEEQVKTGVPFIKVNCGAITPTLLESELFGHVKGAFTGATTDKRGLVESASGGWLFLDEVATLSKAAQVALLRVLENQEVRRVGSSKAVNVSVRIMSATNEDIPKLIKDGEFRGDLWQRLCEVELELPPLRDRPEEIPALVEHFCSTMQGGPYKVSAPALEILKSLSWKNGNIRELRNCLRAMTEMHVDKLLTPIGFPARIWDDFGEKPEDADQVGVDAVPMSGKNTLTISWDKDAGMTYENLADKLLFEMTKNLAGTKGKLSLRALSAAIGMSRSTLSGRLKALVHREVVPIEELSKIVSVSEK